MSKSRLGALKIFLAGSAAILAVNAAAAGDSTTILVPSQPMSNALREVGRETGQNILFIPDSVSGLRPPALSGQMSAYQAVSTLTRGTGLQVVSDGLEGLIVRVPARTIEAQLSNETSSSQTAPLPHLLSRQYRVLKPSSSPHPASPPRGSTPRRRPPSSRLMTSPSRDKAMCSAPSPSCLR